MTAAPLHVRSAPHTIRTVPVLVGLALLSLAAGAVGLSLLQRYNGLPGAVVLFDLVGVALSVFPGVVIAVSALLVTGASMRRRGFGAVAVLAIAAVWWETITGKFSLPVEYFLQVGVFAAAVLAVWLAVRPGAGWGWGLVAAPVVVAVLLAPLARALDGADLSASGGTAVSWGLQLVPFVVAALAGGIATKFSTDAPAVVEQHPPALVDKSA
jgi:hypothetical protein